MMDTLFAQTMTQFAPLREFARIHDTREYSCIIRELFPKALFHEKDASSALFFEIAWSFLSKPITTGICHVKFYEWVIQKIMHRIGGLPAEIYPFMATLKWLQNGYFHRDDKDPRTGFVLPALILGYKEWSWWQSGKLHRIDKDPRTGLTLPASFGPFGLFEWFRNGHFHRDEKDPRTGLMLPALICADGLREWWIDGVKIQ